MSDSVSPVELDELLGAGAGAGAGAGDVEGAGDVAGGVESAGGAAVSFSLEHAANRLSEAAIAITAICVRLICIMILTCPKSRLMKTEPGATNGSAASLLQLA